MYGHYIVAVFVLGSCTCIRFCFDRLCCYEYMHGCSITVYVYRPRIVRIYIGVSERDVVINYDEMVNGMWERKRIVAIIIIISLKVNLNELSNESLTEKDVSTSSLKEIK
jgi:Na+/alanine symporter